MTIREFIIETEIRYYEDRVKRLCDMGAPKVIIDATEFQLDMLKAGKLKVGGAIEKLESEFTGCIKRTGRGGKTYLEFTDGTRYFPNAKYGRFVA